MKHRHLNHSDFTPAAIDDCISRGLRADWAELRMAVQSQPKLKDIILKVCSAYVKDPYAQRYHLWMSYVERTIT
jgi:hypothetical protein